MEINKQKTVNCVGIIMDGNRRWAKEHGVPVFEGHRVGYERSKDVTEWAKEAGIETIILYAFSTENWKRSEEEKSGLFKLLRMFLEHEAEKLNKENIKITFIGQRELFDGDIKEGIVRIEKETEKNTGLHLAIALSYGGRAEIVDAAKRMTASQREDLTEESFPELLWTKDIPDPDIIIRTGGDMRLSNFLLWQSAYAELFFTPTLWPAFSKEEFAEIIGEYENRERRRGA